MFLMIKCSKIPVFAVNHYLSKKKYFQILRVNQHKLLQVSGGRGTILLSVHTGTQETVNTSLRRTGGEVGLGPR